ncbi:MAG: helix-turn-helix transcriptional regulator [Nannocystaceae bacterium]
MADRVTRGELGGIEALVIVLDDQSAADRRDLTASEREVLELALRGAKNQEIAAARGRSPSTIANQLNAIYRKLGVASRREAAALLGRT